MMQGRESQLEKLKSQLIRKVDTAEKESKLSKDYRAEINGGSFARQNGTCRGVEAYTV